jgi:hypothetical protein
MPDYPDLNAMDHETEDALRTLREAAGPVAFAPGFVDRVMARRFQPQDSDAPIRAVFRWIAPTAIAASLILASMNLFQTRGREAPLIDRLLGLPSVSLATAYSFDNDLSPWGVSEP